MKIIYIYIYINNIINYFCSLSLLLMPILHAVQHPPPHPSFNERCIVGGLKLTRQMILDFVFAYWAKRTHDIIAEIAKKLQVGGVLSAIAPEIAEKFVSELRAINSPEPDSFLEITEVEKKVNALLSGERLEKWIGVGCEPSCRELCVGVMLENINQYVEFAWKYMRVHIVPIEMRIGGKVEKYTIRISNGTNVYLQKTYKELSYDTIFRVSSPYYIEDLSPYSTPNLLYGLKDEFRSLILGRCQQFTNSIDMKLYEYHMPYYVHYSLRNNARNYIKKAYNVLVDKFFSMSGLLKLNAFQTKLQILTNVSNPLEDISKDLIDDVLEEIVSFLSETNIL